MNNQNSPDYAGSGNSGHQNTRETAERFYLLASQLTQAGVRSDHITWFADTLISELPEIERYRLRLTG